jgi:hypothetical protein
MTAQPYKPEGYASVSVYLMVQGAQGIIDFLREALCGEPLRRFDNPGGTGNARRGDARGCRGACAFAHPRLRARCGRSLCPRSDSGRCLGAGPCKRAILTAAAGSETTSGNVWWLSHAGK